MENISQTIISVIDSIFKPDSYFYSEYFKNKLKKPLTLKFVAEIIRNSDKSPAEAVIVTLVTLKYYFKDINALNNIEAQDSFETLLENHYNELLKIAINGKVQGNGPERALPILEILSKLVPDNPVGVIELGASFGLIGYSLLNPNSLLDNKDTYFNKAQQFPESVKKADFYLGIDLAPPEKDWLISCIINTEDAQRIHNYINHYKPKSNFNLIQASALHFPNLKEVKGLIDKNIQLIILTSFMLYQLNESTQNELSLEINNFCKNYNAHWIKQEVFFSENNSILQYFIELDNQRIIKLADDKCSSWIWLQ